MNADTLRTYSEVWTQRCDDCRTTTRHRVSFTIGWAMDLDLPGAVAPVRDYGDSPRSRCPVCGDVLRLLSVADDNWASAMCLSHCRSASPETFCNCVCHGEHHGKGALEATNA